MKNLYLILCIGAVMIFSFLVGRHFYVANVNAMRTQAESTFVHTLKRELENKMEALNIPYSSFNMKSGTVPLIVYVTTESGKRMYKVDAEKSKKNISQSRLERSLQSVSLVESPLVADTLNQYWWNTLCDCRIYAKTAIRISVTDPDAKISYSGNSPQWKYASCQFTYLSYLGSRCEVEVMGYLKYTWWDACLYNWFPFFWNTIVTIVVFILLFYFFKLRNKSPKVEFIEKEILCEVVRYVKEVNGINSELYHLEDGLMFDSIKHLLIKGKEELKLSPTSSAILKLFLDAPEYTVTDDELIENIWEGISGATIQNFRSAAQRIYNTFGQVGFSVKFIRVGINKYTMVFADPQ